MMRTDAAPDRTDLVVKFLHLAAGPSLLQDHEGNATPTRAGKLCPFREVFLRELAPRDEETFRAFGDWLTRVTAISERVGSLNVNRLQSDIEGLLEEIRNLKQVCIFITDVHFARDSGETEMLAFVDATSALLGVVSRLFEEALRPLERPRETGA